eukprot:TRINITY_DN8317_c0_g1_i1.p1 TRINITY_DN8317_c0_g1~~TRINITY_DN8317_c0_g1_i1.p1  ORF type:complete len:326 (+),score=115.76 TRINITY_DN8317_c0_g1_i1:71-1048(+)
MPRMVDPHFHIWDVRPETLPDGHNLFAPNGAPIYDVSCYEADIDRARTAGMEVVGGVHVEARSVAYPEMGGEALNKLCVEETAWVVAQLGRSGRAYNVVASASLEAGNAGETLAALVACSTEKVKVVGVRQILNHTPSWPRNDAVGELLDNPEFAAGFALLARHGLSFDAQLNPHQYAKACALFAAHPEVTVCVNHLGTPTPAHVTPGTPENGAYTAGLAQLAALPQCYLKISMLWYAAPAPADGAASPYSDACPDVAAAVDAAVALFTPRRCMFASNYPVDGLKQQTCAGIYKAFAAHAARYSQEDQERLFAGTACEAYKLTVG